MAENGMFAYLLLACVCYASLFVCMCACVRFFMKCLYVCMHASVCVCVEEGRLSAANDDERQQQLFATVVSTTHMKN